MNTKIFLIILATIFWSSGSWWWYSCKIKSACTTDTYAQTQVIANDETPPDSKQTTIANKTDDTETETVDSMNTGFIDRDPDVNILDSQVLGEISDNGLQLTLDGEDGTHSENLATDSTLSEMGDSLSNESDLLADSTPQGIVNFLSAAKENDPVDNASLADLTFDIFNDDYSVDDLLAEYVDYPENNNDAYAFIVNDPEFTASALAVLSEEAHEEAQAILAPITDEPTPQPPSDIESGHSDNELASRLPGKAFKEELNDEENSDTSEQTIAATKDNSNDETSTTAKEIATDETQKDEESALSQERTPQSKLPVTLASLHTATEVLNQRRDKDLKKLPSKRIIAFPSSSTSFSRNKENVTYLNELTDWLISDLSHTVILVGHTDNKGDQSGNLLLGLIRAATLKKELIRLGAPNHSVLIESRGNSSPLASNETVSGRKQNRRVEVIPKSL